MKKIVGLLAAIMVLSLTACGGGSEESKATKEHVYRMEEVSIEEVEDKNTISDYFLREDTLYIIGYNWMEESRETYIVKKKLDGSESSMVTLTLTNNQYMGSLTVDDEGNYYCVLNEYFEDNSDPENYVWEENYYLLKMDGEGNELWKQSLKGEGEDSYYGVNWMKILGDGRIAIADAYGLTLYDTQGNVLKKVKQEEDSYMGDLIQLTDGTILNMSYSSENNKYMLQKMDIETGEKSEEYYVPGISSMYSYFPGISHDLLLVSNVGVYGYNLGDEEVTELMNFIDSDLNASYVYSIVPVSETEFYGMINDNLTGNTVLMKFTKVDPKDVVDKKILTLGCNGIGWDIRNQVVQFNKTNEKYRIQIRDYSQYNTDEDYTVGLTRLNTDIASGYVPDILVMDTSLPVESYISKGLFEDLYGYIDKDEELNKEDYFQNILRAYESNGKLYQLVPSFSIFTVAGKTSDVGAEPGWTLEELNEVMAGKPEGTLIFARETRASMLQYSIQMSSGQFINWETGECKYNSDAFIQLLEFLKQFPEQYDDGDYNDEFWRSYDSLWRDDKVLLSISYLDGFPSYNYMKKGTFGVDITLKGFPAEDRNGSTIIPNLDLVMAAKSKHKEGAWEFMRYFLMDEYQNSISYGWPLSLARVETMAEEAMRTEPYEDSFGNMVGYAQSYFVGDVEIKIDPITKEEVDDVINFIMSVDRPHTYDENLINIISEEAAPYFSGQKNAKEVADIIQSRVQIYVNENR